MGMKTEKNLIRQQMSKIDELRCENDILRDYIRQYKDKEDKLREYINNEKNSYYEKDEDNAIKIITLTKFLQILNEGSDIQ